ncbi:Coenzyme Q-binding protein coq10, mitochondrial [Fusarium austroafricanum]|uniref:Coenzyme Q-binding protein coq10, mitochondrial n=1 Tax=Fusarium austroafricanum TaxID=2364996 RepID=A0A8H4PC14_9HYPO|nr:Coenzyme Q-binding protein coq10, mitochondrial [Fusarium austroafricanum]
MALRLVPSRAVVARSSASVSNITNLAYVSTPHCRSFITLPSSEPQRLTANRILPYPAEPLYDLIADVDSYSSFVPYCSRSRVTLWSDPDPATGRRYPTLADLHVGWGGFDEVFTSRLRCVPGQSVEAISGETAPGGTGPDASAVFRSLVTRWSVRSTAGPPLPRTEVNLTIDFQFTNPLYGAVSAAVSDKVASMMIEAFEKKAFENLGPERRL